MKIQYNLSSGNMEHFHIKSVASYQGNIIFWGYDSYSNSSKFLGFLPLEKEGFLFDIEVIGTGEAVDANLDNLKQLESFSLGFIHGDSLRVFGKPSEYVLEDGSSIEDRPYETLEFDNLLAFDFFNCHYALSEGEIQRRISIAVEEEEYELAESLTKLLNEKKPNSITDKMHVYLLKKGGNVWNSRSVAVVVILHFGKKNSYH